MAKTVLLLISIILAYTLPAQQCKPVKVVLFDDDTREEIKPKKKEDVTIAITALANDSSFTLTGTTFCLPRGKYKVTTNVYCYMRWSKEIELEIYNPDDTIELIESFRHVAHCGVRRLPYIYFESKKYELNSIGQKQLDTLISIMLDNPTIVMSIGGHTDSRGDSKANMRLSEQRAKVVYDYLISKGVARARLEMEANGETELLNFCVDGKTCSEEEHAINNRVNFKITRYDYKETQ